MSDDLNTETNRILTKKILIKESILKGECQLGPLTSEETCDKCYELRLNAAEFQRAQPIPSHPCNGDEDRYSNKIGNFSKALPHNRLGEVDINAYNIWIRALSTANTNLFEDIPLGGDMLLANPQACYAFDMIGANSAHFTMLKAPKFSSAQIATEIAELYWRAITRDIPFSVYESSELIRVACNDLSTFSDYRGPKVCAKITPKTIFRGSSCDNLIGPFISQFLALDIPYGSKLIEQRYITVTKNKNYMTSYNDWLNVQNGISSQEGLIYEPVERYIRNGRDLGEWVHNDFTYEALLNTTLILLAYGEDALDKSNPYLYSRTQKGFVTFGAAHILDLVAKAVRVALESAWFQKFLVHRRLRPEAFAGCIHNNLVGSSDYPINCKIFESTALNLIYDRYGTYLLPMAYPEGSPTHPSYPAGHACGIGAGVTILKAFFNEDFIIPNPVVASVDGLSLNEYKGELLDISGELNKLAANISHGRDTAGVHYRSDGEQGIKLGEDVAISILQDYRKCYNEDFSGFTLTKFDGTKIVV